MKQQRFRKLMLLLVVGVLGSSALVSWLLPAISWSSLSTEKWQSFMAVWGVMLVIGLIPWTYFWLRNNPESLGPDEHRRRAHDYPFLLSAVLFGWSVTASIATGVYFTWSGAALTEALVTSIVCYLVMVLPVPWIYILARSLLQSTARAPVSVGRITGLRQGIGLRLAFAMQVPILVCAAGMVLVETQSREEYDQNVEAFFEGQRAGVYQRLLHAMNDDVQRRRLAAITAGTISSDNFSDRHDSESESLPWIGFLVLCIITVLSNAVGRWLTRDVGSDLDAVGAALRRLTAAERTFSLPRGVALREIADVIEAFRTAMIGFEDQERQIREATAQRREAEREKTRFLAHLSHELKSPLNSILGFSELMLAELDGPVGVEQREHLGQIWRDGDSLLRFILAILDLTRLDGLESGDDEREMRAAGLSPASLSSVGFMEALQQQYRYDPLKRRRVELTAIDADSIDRTLADSNLSARALLLVAGSTLEMLEEGVVEIQLGLSDEGHLVATVRPQFQGAAPEELVQLWRTAFTDSRTDSAVISDCPHRLVVPIRLLRMVERLQGGVVNLDFPTQGPVLRYTMPSS